MFCEKFIYFFIFLICFFAQTISANSEDDQICKFDDEKLTQKMQSKLHDIRHEYERADIAAQKKLSHVRSHEPLDDEFEKEYESFKNNYRVLLNVMKIRPAFCERIIEELEEAIKHFYKRATS